VTKSAFWSAAAGAAAVISLNVSAPAHAEWMEAKSPHFIVYGDMSEQALRARTERLERFDALLRTKILRNEPFTSTNHLATGSFI
jgi:hypothetical protein